MSVFKDQTILITGAASGLGWMMAEKLAAEGAHLVLWDLNEEGLNTLKTALGAKARVGTYVCDLSSREAIQATAQAVHDAEGTVDILINNAGIVSGKPLLEIPDAHIERTFAVNTLALFWTTRAFLPGMIAQKSGHIVTIASAGGLVGTSRLTDYCSSKFAAVGFDDSLRLELKRLGTPIHTTVVCPFFIDTGMFAGVKSRFGWLIPILKPEYAVRRILGAIRKRKRRLIRPRFVYTVFPVRLLPVTAFDGLMNFFGINHSMDDFVGRSKTSS